MSRKLSKARTVFTASPMKQDRPPFPAMDELSADEREILRFLRIQLLQQASDVQIAHNNRNLRAELKHDADAIRTELEQLADRGYVERRTGLFASGVRTYAYRLTEAGEAAVRGAL
jgi:DNA-binding MarR family transcriptional regulator